VKQHPIVWPSGLACRPRVLLELRDLEGRPRELHDAQGQPLPADLDNHNITDLMLGLCALNNEELREIIVILVASIHHFTHAGEDH